MSDLVGHINCTAQPDNLPAASVKEMLQNAFDAIKADAGRGAVSKVGNIDVVLSTLPRE
jgi:hypothetical protein